MGTGGAPEGVITAGARRGLYGENFAGRVRGARGCDYGGGAPVLERANSGAASGDETSRYGAAGENGGERSSPDLRHGRLGTGEKDYLCVLRGDGWKFVKGCAVFWRRRTHDVDDFDAR